MIISQKKLHIFWIVIAGLLVAWLVFTRSQQTLPTTKDKEVLSTSTGLIIHQFDKLGQLHYIGTAAHAIEFTSQNTLLSKVRLTLFDPNKINPPWHGSADSAYAWQRHNKVDLSGHVVFRRTKSKRTHASELQTNKLSLFLNTHEANTDSEVRISEPGTKNVTTAVGMRANWQLQTAHFLHKVNSTYEPKRDN